MATSAAPIEMPWGGEGKGWRQADQTEFVDAGMLYRSNTNLWPYGLALTATIWGPKDQLERDLKPRIRKALELALQDSAFLDVKDGPLDDALVDQFFDDMTEDLSGIIQPGFYLTEPDPIDTIVTGLTRAEVQVRERAAIKYRVARLQRIRARAGE